MLHDDSVHHVLISEHAERTACSLKAFTFGSLYSRPYHDDHICLSLYAFAWASAGGRSLDPAHDRSCVFLRHDVKTWARGQQSV